ncbi:MAG: tRNA (adenosine(37)-N6)-threonylcarbamoyltransferase complex ATPase subunit type 1 TsaE [Minisyncoccota bacterium]
MHIMHTTSTEETRACGQKLAERLIPGTVLCLTGDLGAGKTTLTQGLLGALGALPPYVSPTFVIMKQYTLPAPTKRGIERVYHVDAYRIEAWELEPLGFAEWCADPHGIVILEWPERVASILSSEVTRITITSKGENEREIFCT